MEISTWPCITKEGEVINDGYMWDPVVIDDDADPDEEEEGWVRSDVKGQGNSEEYWANFLLHSDYVYLFTHDPILQH